MKGLKGCPANSCQPSLTRKWSVELDAYDLYAAFFVALLNDGISDSRMERLWRKVWVNIKRQQSYTVRVNGRVTIRKQWVVSATTRAKMEKVRRRENG